jgi:Niemann-Pick C1 protein
VSVIHTFASFVPSGHAAYGNALARSPTGEIVASYFMTYHTPLKSSADFIGATREARNIAKNITQTIVERWPAARGQVDVYPYSMFYVFYEQYNTLVWDAVLQLLLSLAAIFLVTAALLGLDPWSAGMITITITMILIDLLGLMYWWQIDFNAISLVNLVMAIGISVEFCSHLVRQFALSIQTSRVERAKAALATMGSSVSVEIKGHT